MAKISKEKINELADWLDEIVELKGLTEQFDGFMFSIALKFLNNRFGEQIPDTLTPVIEQFIDDLTSENYEGAEKTVAEIMAELINTPLIDGTDEEVEAYQTIISGIDQFVRSLIKNHKKVA